METLTLPVNPRDRRFGPKKKLNPWHLRVLVVDDNEAERLLTIRQLREAWPFERPLVAEYATDGVEALDKVRHHAYAFVVLDWNLPHPAGTDMLRVIRADGRRVPIIVVSEQPRAAIASDLESLAAAYVNKRELNPIRFRNAMAAAILLQQAVFGVVSVDSIQVYDSLPAPAMADRFVRRPPQLFVRPAALVELR